MSQPLRALTRRQFDQACQDLVAKYNSKDRSSGSHTLLKSWSWNEHPVRSQLAFSFLSSAVSQTFPGLGYLSRDLTIPLHRDDTPGSSLADFETLDSEAGLDDAAASSAPSVVDGYVAGRMHVVHSATFQVPVLCFSMHHSSACAYTRPVILIELTNDDEDGAPLSLVEICRLPLFRPEALHGSQVASFAVQDPKTAMALLSQGDHPTLGIPCWYIHPCNTSAVVGEIMSEVAADDAWTEAAQCLRWLEAWFMVLGNMLCLDS